MQRRITLSVPEIKRNVCLAKGGIKYINIDKYLQNIYQQKYLPISSIILECFYRENIHQK